MSRFEFDCFEFASEDRLLRKNGQLVPLTPKAADLLMLFVEHPQTVFSSEDLKKRVWPTTYVADTNVTFQLNAVQKALGKRPNGEKYIKNFPKRGYQFVAPVQERCPIPTHMLVTPAALDQSLSLKNRCGPVEGVTDQPRSVWSSKGYRVLCVAGAAFVVAFAVMLAKRLAPPPGVWVARYDPLTNDGLQKTDRGLLLTDGVRVYFQERSLTGWNMAAVSITGGATEPIRLPVGFRDIHDLSPNTSELLASRSASDPEGDELWVVPLLGDSPSRITGVRAHSATWSPGRKKIAVALENALYVVKADGSDRRKIAEVSGQVDWPRWSPDEKTIRFTEETRPKNGDILDALWEVGADGAHQHRLLQGWNDSSAECCGVWTPDGKLFVFQATREGRTDLWALPERRGFFGIKSDSPVRLSSGSQSFSYPVITADGKQILAFGTERRGELVRYDIRLRGFVPALGGISATWVSFSPSGHSVAYIKYPELTLWRGASDGSEKSQITFSPFQADGLSWSPDEKQLAIRGRTAGGPWRIYLVPSTGGAAEELIPGESNQGIPTWSADGSRIAFGDIPAVHGKASGKEAIHLLELRNHTVSDFPGSQGLWTVRWSPDGRFLAALAIEGERLMLYDFTMRKWRATQAGNVNNPTWSLDGKYIYFDTEETDRALRRLRVADRHVDQLVSLQAYPTLAWWWSGVAPDNSPLILRDLGSTEVYSLLLATDDH